MNAGETVPPNPPATEEAEENHPVPWDELREGIIAGDDAALENLVNDLSSEERRRAFSRLSEAEQTNVIETLNSQQAASVIECLPDVQSANILGKLDPEVSADIVENLPADVSSSLLQDLKESEDILDELDDSAEAENLRELSAYHPQTAGALMHSEVVAFPENFTVGQLLDGLRDRPESLSDQDVQYIFTMDGDEKLSGVLRLRDLIVTPRSKPIAEIMIPDPVSVTVDTVLEELDKVFEERKFVGLPVVTAEGTLRGVISRADVNEAHAEHSAGDYLAASGIVGGEELRSMPLLLRCFRRLSWLAPNIALNLIAASVIAMYESTIQSVIALAVFLPIVSDMSGCSGNQAVAVSMRELTLGLLRPTEFLRVIWKEGLLGIINGTILGILLGTIAAIWKDNIWLGLVIGGALALNTVLSVLLGGIVPLIMKRLKIDPALASGPILTTCTDMCGFFLVLNIAAAMMSKLA